MRNSSARPAAVSFSADSIACASEGGMRSRRPMTRRRTPAAAQVGGFGAKIFLEQREQAPATSLMRAFPIVRGERIERERADAQAGSGADDAADGFDAGAMAFGARQAARGSPAAIAIEQDGDVEFGLGCTIFKVLLFIEYPGKIFWRA